MGSAATIDMLEKMGVNKHTVQFLYDIYNETISQLRKKQKAVIIDSDHLKFMEGLIAKTYAKRMNVCR
ncbi:hypothetical protein ES703_71318 [subsurface metagenome]